MKLSVAVERSQNSFRPVNVTFNGTRESMLAIVNTHIENVDELKVTTLADGRLDVFAFCPTMGQNVFVFRLTVTLI